jgi:tetratricopeptide (TPR) repeat protein
MLADAVIPALRAGSPDQACAIGERALVLSGGAGDSDELRASLTLGIALALAGDLERGRGLVLRAGELSEPDVAADPRLRSYLGLALRLVGEHEAARAALSTLADEARWQGAIGILAYALVRLADVDLDTGRWQDARAALVDAVALARETGQAADLGLASGALAWLAAVQGREHECRERATVAIELAERLGAGSRLDRVDQALGLLALAGGELESAIDLLDRVCRLKLEQGWSDAAVPPHCAPDLVEALVVAGRFPEARRKLDVFLADARRCGRVSAQAAALRCEGLLAAEDAFHVHFEAALAVDERLTGPFERARTALWYARRVRANHATGADGMLRSALDTFSALGAEPWVALTRAELAAPGTKSPPSLAVSPI